MSESTVEAVQNAPASKSRFRNPLNGPIRALAKRLAGENYKEMERFLRFACVGVTGALLDLGTLTVLQATILPPARIYDNPLTNALSYQQPVLFATSIDMNVALATTIAFLVAVISNFIWTYTWVYPESTSRSIRRQLAQFIFIGFVGWSSRTLWITTMYRPIGALITPIAVPFIQIFDASFVSTPVTQDRLGTTFAQLIAMGVVMLWNFFANRYWTFSDVD
mgnify:CR=1 FL=1